MKDFVTAVKDRKNKDRDSLKFKIDPGTDQEQEVTSRRPTEGQLSQLISIESGGTATEDERVAAIINFCVAILDAEGAVYIRRRLLDGDDDFELDDVMDLVSGLVEEWSARPTKPSSDSTSSSQSSGSGLTDSSPSEESTSSTSKSLAPAT